MSGHVDERLAEAFAPFRRRRRPSDALPEPAIEAVRRRSHDFSLIWEESRAVHVTSAPRIEYLVPGRDVVGRYDGLGHGGLMPTEMAVQGRCIGSSFLGTGALLIDGLLPDDATETRIVRRNGDLQEFVVTENVFETLVEARAIDELPEAVEFLLRGERRRVDVPGADDAILQWRSPGSFAP